jgi:two-component system phosphate regulon response regulator PhoB
MHLTIVDDLEENLEIYQDVLEREFKLQLIQQPLKLFEFLQDSKTDLLLLDFHLPNIDGFELFKKIRKTHKTLPIIFITGDPSEETMINALKLGAVDFLRKPVSIPELIARIKNKISSTEKKKAELGKENIIKINNFSLFCEMQLAQIDDKKIQLTPIEFKLIQLLAKNPNKIFSRDYITNLLWPDVHVQNQNIDTHLSNLRKKLKPFSQNIKTIKSRGYILRI